ncbi:MAG: hypothetical protein COA91_04880 [Robiginitomaculum sp.]|nr:MAG: hypothetical protein COA91_04880 [Robiginitomaculum sp.]
MMSKFFTFVSAIAVLAIISPLGTGHANAGTGEFDASNGHFNFCVSVRFKASDAQIKRIKERFNSGSQILADATDNQHRFGNIRVINDSGASKAAEYWINSGSGRAFATLGKYGTRGEHVNLYYDSNFNAKSGVDGDSYTIAHEHVHHAYSIADEYSGPMGNAENAPASAETATLNYSLMDNYFTRGGRGPNGNGTTYTLNELSVKSNHDPDRDTFQSSINNNESDWETIAKSKYPAIAPKALPVSAAPAAHTVTFEDASGNLKTMLVVDRSGSMQTDNRIGFAKQGVTLFTNILKAQDSVGLASFSSSAGVNTNLALATPAHVASVNAAANSLVASGLTNIGGGLQAGLTQLTSQTSRSCNELIILFSDGDHNTGTNPISVIPSIKNEGVAVISVAIGSGLSSSGLSTLQTIGTQTGGEFFQVQNGFQLLVQFARLAAEASNQGILAQQPTLQFQNTEVQSFPLFVENNVSTITVIFTRAQTSDDFSIKLLDPAGTDVTASGGVVRNDVGNAVEFTISSPAAGEWMAEFTANAVSDGRAEFLSFADGGKGALFASVRDENIVFPAPIIIEATPQFEGIAVTNGAVAATVIRPDGGPVNIPLFDDGTNGDFIAGDGIYTAEFRNYDGSGTYTFDVTVNTTPSSQINEGESLFAGIDPANVKVVEKFVRVATTSVIVNNVPDIVRGDIDGDGDVDSNDINLLLTDKNLSTADSRCGDVCDLNGDGVINIIDARLIVPVCTRAACATEN